MTKNERRVAMRRLNDPNYKRADPAPASLRVAEELVEKCAIAIWQRHGMADEWDDVSEVGRANWRRTAAAIITLAQDAAYLNVAVHWENEILGQSEGAYSRDEIQAFGIVAAQARAMMVKP